MSKPRFFDKRKYKESVRSSESFQYKEQPFGHQIGSLGYFAHRMRMRPTTLIAMFSKAGIRGLTPNHVLENEQWNTLINFHKSLREIKSESIYQDNTSIEKKLVLVQDINLNLLHQLSNNPKLIHELGSRKFEELIAKLLEEQGCEVSLTKRTRDGGYDIFGRVLTGPSDLVFIAECKRYSAENKVGVEVVRNLYGVTEIQKANLGLIITSSSFTKDAREEKLRIGPRIGLKDYQDLCNWLAPYSKQRL